MSRRYHEIKQLSEQTATGITRNGEQWAKFLDTAGRVYRYPFEDPLLSARKLTHIEKR